MSKRIDLFGVRVIFKDEENKYKGSTHNGFDNRYFVQPFRIGF